MAYSPQNRLTHMLLFLWWIVSTGLTTQPRLRFFIAMWWIIPDFPDAGWAVTISHLSFSIILSTASVALWGQKPHFRVSMNQGFLIFLILLSVNQNIYKSMKSLLKLDWRNDNCIIRSLLKKLILLLLKILSLSFSLSLSLSLSLFYVKD